MHIPHKGICDAHSAIAKWDVRSCEIQYHFVEIIWNFYGMVMDPKYVVVWICGIFWPSLALIVIIYSITK
jgi:hypothetical protein